MSLKIQMRPHDIQHLATADWMPTTLVFGGFPDPIGECYTFRNAFVMATVLIGHFCFLLFMNCIPKQCSVRSRLWVFEMQHVLRRLTGTSPKCNICSVAAFVRLSYSVPPPYRNCF